MKKIIIILSLLLSVMQLPAKTVRQMWLEMPDSLIPYLNKNLRIELVDFIDLGVKSEVKNLLSDTTTMDTLSADYLRVRCNPSMTIEMKMLPKTEGDSLLCVIKTFTAGDAESETELYDVNWQQLPSNNLFDAKSIEANKQDLFYKPDTITNERYVELKSRIDPVMLKISLSPASNELTLSLAEPLMTNEEKLDVKSIIKQKKLKWDGEKFIRVKK